MKRYFVVLLLVLTTLLASGTVMFASLLLATSYSNCMSIKERAEQGDHVSQRVLGYGYETGILETDSLGQITRDPQKAIFWYEKAASNGDVQAYQCLAEMYRRMGKETRAHYWQRKAAQAAPPRAASQKDTFIDAIYSASNER